MEELFFAYHSIPLSKQSILKRSAEEEAKLRFRKANFSAKKLISEYQKNQGFANKTTNTKSTASKKQRSRESNKLLDQGVELAKNKHIYSAIDLHSRALAIDAENYSAIRNLSVLLKRIGNTKEAEELIRSFLKLFPRSADGWNTLGTILSDQANFKESGEAYRKAVEIDPGNAVANSNLAGMYHYSGLIDPAYIYSSKAIALNPSSKELWLEHLTQIRRVCDFESFEKVNWWSVAKSADFNSLGPSFLQLLACTSTDGEQLELNKILKHWASEAKRRSIIDVDKISKKHDISKTIRIGLISSDFKEHSVARFIWPLFKYIDRNKYSLYCYSGEKKNDQWQQNFKISATKFNDVSTMSPKELIKVIQEDNVDILFDLTGFTQGSKTSLFANRIAKHQATWLGYPGSTGLDTMDYLFADKYLAPKDDNLIVEKILMTQGTSVCFAGNDEVPIASTLPEGIRGFITFGTLNNPYKYTRKMLINWARILDEVKGSQFLFVRREFSSYYLRKNIIKVFEANGISSERIHFYNNRQAGRNYLDCYNDIDITLDTYPVTGGTTTADALWMGVPVITKVGKNIHQRVSAAILHHANRSEWISHNDDEYINNAISLAKNKHLRTMNKQSLRTEIKNSDLCDERKFTQDFCSSIDNVVR